MKCLCGYEYVEQQEDYANGEEIIIQEQIGGRPFFEASTHLVFNFKQGDWDVDRIEFRGVFACPKCGALKVEI